MNTHEFSKEMRKKIIMMAELCDTELYWGGYMSSVEILSVLYNDCMRMDESLYENKDKFILSKGHSGLAMYVAMQLRGMLSMEELMSFGQKGSMLTKLASAQKKIGVECSGGSLGIGLPMGVGMALLAKKKEYRYKTYVLVGDGEMDEGSNWEGLSCAAKYQLDNLIVIVDHNKFQADGSCEEIMPKCDLAERARAFGCEAYNIDGHNIEELQTVLMSCGKEEKPVVIVANTIKGKGISFMENTNEWHHTRLNKSFLEQAKREVGI